MIACNPVYITHKESFGSFIHIQTLFIFSDIRPIYRLHILFTYLLSSITTEFGHSNLRWHHRVGDVGYMMFFCLCQHKKLKKFKFFQLFLQTID